MPIKLTFDHPNWLVMGVASGVLTLTDLAAAAEEITRGGLLHYCKLIDAANCTTTLTLEELSAFTRVMRTRPTRADVPRGPLAVVVDPRSIESAHVFAQLDFGWQPAKLFHNIHEARRWLSRQMPGNEWMSAGRPTLLNNVR